MEPPSNFRITRVPKGYNTIEGWLADQDNSPRCIPSWPTSKRMCLVACCVDGLDSPDETPAEAFVLTERSQADRLVNFCGPSLVQAVLFFRLPKMSVLDPAVCPEGLTAESWK